MKLLVLNYEYPPLGGGAGVITQNIAQGLVKLGNSVCVVTTGFKDLPPDSLENDVRVIRLPSKRRFVFQSNPVEMWSWMKHANTFLRKHLKTEKYDLCFANFSIPGGAVALNMKREFGLPYTVISHGHDIPWFFPRQMVWYHLILYHKIREIVLNSEANFVQSNEMKRNIDLFTGNLFASKNHLIYNGWNSSVFTADYSKRKSEFILLFVGRLVPQKDPFTFLKAVKIAATTIDLQVHILGDGPLRAKMEKWVTKNHLSEKVKFFGWVDKPEMLYQYQSAAVTVLPSLSEGMSIATLEALASGQYVIATRVSNNESLIVENINGNLLNMKDHTMLADLIVKFYHEKFLKYYRIPPEELEKYRSLYEWDGIVEQYNNIFARIIGS
ncbi:MAG: glycosyltransferase family 4 protein [Bacteroidales bacterium]|nr:glycosyltransferase family 4 protein [Bacteroidales bacterium]HOY38444.1 glycosyltransferase family 4 protein [Bacteroidales bacterium]HQP03135.1 glycosyltransferase family 4 protein [Bacteroidales bacterium]